MPVIYRALATNKLAASPHYSAILEKYNDEWKRTNGKVNESKFWREIIIPLMPDYKRESFYQFLRRFKDAAGIVALDKMNQTLDRPMIIGPDKNEATAVLTENLVSNQVATQRGINAALNVGKKTLERLLTDPAFLSLIPPKDRAELLFKAMRAQDSRIHALGAIREDQREQARFDRAFSEAAYGDDV